MPLSRSMPVPVPLSEALLSEATLDGQMPFGDEGNPALDLGDLVSDKEGEVVLFNDSGLRSLVVRTSAEVVDEGEAKRHVTAAGEDVTGFRYVAFDNGLKLYYQPDLELVLQHPRARPS